MAIPTLASEVSVSLIGVGSYLPDHRVSNEEILEYLRPARPDGRRLEPEWVVKHLGIDERHLDYEFGGRRKRSRADGGLYDGDLALLAGPAIAPATITHADTRRIRRPTGVLSHLATSGGRRRHSALFSRRAVKARY